MPSLLFVFSAAHRPQFARWVEDAKRDETRERRVAETVRMLHDRTERS